MALKIRLFPFPTENEVKMSRIYYLKTNCRALHADPSKPLSLPAQQLIHFRSLGQSNPGSHGLLPSSFSQQIMSFFHKNYTRGLEKLLGKCSVLVHNIYIKESKESLF